LEPAHTMVAQACLGALLHIDEHVTRDSLRKFPLARYAAKYWMDHARFENVLPSVLDGMKVLFDPSKPHLTIWVWISDPDDGLNREELSQTPSKPSGTPLHYAALCGICEVAEFLIVERLQDVDARGLRYEETPLCAAFRKGCTEVARILLQHGAEANARDKNNRTPLHWASEVGHLEVVQLLLNHGADATDCDDNNQTPLHLVSSGNRYS
jgi:ankyrin repeat protein